MLLSILWSIIQPAVHICAQLSCILEFDGASKGNPGKAGAGAVLRAEDGSVVCSQLSEFHALSGSSL